MSDVQDVTKFEFLPNEILIECLTYLSGIDIFYAFDFLNNRYSNLIQSIPLHLNFGRVQKSTFDQFCERILLNRVLKKQIYSLQLSHQTVCDQISKFLSRFSLDQFLHLRSLCFTEDNEGYTGKNIGLLDEIDNIVRALSRCTIQSLSVPMLKLNFAVRGPFTSIINLTISRGCSVKKVCLFFKYFPKLQYLSINSLMGFPYWRIKDFGSMNEHAATHLKELIVRGHMGSFLGFNSLETILRKAQNLRNLTIIVCGNLDVVDPPRWQRLIQSALPRLTNFKFLFCMVYRYERNDMYKRFEDFQSNFWHQKHWYTEYALSEECAEIYTIPYPSNKYTLISCTKRYYDISNADLSAFDKVMTLKLSLKSITSTCEHYFSSVKSLELDNNYEYEVNTYPLLEIKHVKSLKIIINLYNLKHLDISSELLEIESPLVLLSIMKEAPNISSLKINEETLVSLFTNQDVCEYIRKKITKLDVLGDYFDDPDELMKMCKRFSNIEQLKGYCDGSDHLVLVINELVAYSKMKVFSFNTSTPNQMNRWLQNQFSGANIYSFKRNCDTYGDIFGSEDDFHESESHYSIIRCRYCESYIYSSGGCPYCSYDYEYYPTPKYYISGYECAERLDFNVTEF